MRCLWHWEIDCGREGHLEGLFVADKAEVEKAFGKTLAFHDVLGKHSEIIVDFDPDDVTLISDDENFVVELQAIFQMAWGRQDVPVLLCGYYPLDYLPEEDEGDDIGQDAHGFDAE